MTAREAEVLIDELAAKVGEHFDAVQILVSWTDEGSTYCSKRGRGNWYARMGMCHEFIKKNEADDAACLIAEKINPPNEGDDWKDKA